MKALFLVGSHLLHAHLLVSLLWKEQTPSCSCWLFKTNVLGVKTDVLGEFLEFSTSYKWHLSSLLKKKKKVDEFNSPFRLSYTRVSHVEATDICCTLVCLPTPIFFYFASDALCSRLSSGESSLLLFSLPCVTTVHAWTCFICVWNTYISMPLASALARTFYISCQLLYFAKLVA